LLMTRAAFAGKTAPVEKTTITASSPVLLRLVSDQPERSQSAGPVQAISTHSSDVERSDPIHITSLMTADAEPISANA